VDAGIAGEQAGEGIRRWAQEGLGDADRGTDTKRIAVVAGVLRGDPTLLAGDTDGACPMGVTKNGEPTVEGVRFGYTRANLGLGEVAETAEEIMELVGVACLTGINEALEFQLRLFNGRRVEQFTQFVLSQEVPEEVAVQRERLGSALGKGGIAFVHVGGDVVEEKAASERGCLLGFGGGHADLARADVREDFDEAGEVKNIAEAFAVGLEDDREGAVAAGDGEEVRRALALEPERGALPGAATREEERAGGVFAEVRGKEG
jgi:hypothetical protein